MRARGRAIAVAIAIAIAPSSARAALTDSEKAQIVEAYAKGDAATIQRTRALLARTDNQPAEVASVFEDAVRRTTFDAKHRAWMKELLFGPATQALRTDLVPIVVAGLLARGAEVAGATGANDHAREIELVRIHGFVDAEIASAGSPPREGHDAAAGIRDDALRAAVAAYRAHLALPILDRARLTPPMRVARTQAELALADLAAGLVPRADVAAWMGADATERRAFERTGMLVVGLASAAPGKTAAVARMIESLAPSLEGASLLWIGKPRPLGLATRGATIVAETSLTSTRRAPPTLWSNAVAPATPDAALAEIAFVLAREAAVRAIDADPAIAASADGALERARRGGESAFLSPLSLATGIDPTAKLADAPLSREELAARAVELLLLDGPRAISAGVASAVAGRFEPIEQASLGLAILTRGADGKLAESATVGRLDENGEPSTSQLGKIRGAHGEVKELVVEGKTILIARAADSAVASVEIDKRPPSIASLPLARVPTSPGDRWTSPSAKDVLTLVRISGKPEAGLVDATRFLVRARDGAGRGLSAVALTSDARAKSDDEASFDLRLGRGAAAFVVRASAGSSGLVGAAVLLEGGAEPRAQLVAFDGAGAKLELAPPVALTKAGPDGFAFTVKTTKDQLEATIGGQKLSAKLPDFLSPETRDVAFAVASGVDIEVSHWKRKAKKR